MDNPPAPAGVSQASIRTELGCVAGVLHMAVDSARGPWRRLPPPSSAALTEGMVRSSHPRPGVDERRDRRDDRGRVMVGLGHRSFEWHRRMVCQCSDWTAPSARTLTGRGLRGVPSGSSARLDLLVCTLVFWKREEQLRVHTRQERLRVIPGVFKFFGSTPLSRVAGIPWTFSRRRSKAC